MPGAVEPQKVPRDSPCEECPPTQDSSPTHKLCCLARLLFCVLQSSCLSMSCVRRWRATRLRSTSLKSPSKISATPWCAFVGLALAQLCGRTVCRQRRAGRLSFMEHNALHGIVAVSQGCIRPAKLLLKYFEQGCCLLQCLQRHRIKRALALY